MTAPSPEPKTNLMIADIVLRSAGRLIRHDLEERMVVQQYDPEMARDMVNGRTILTSLMLYGASRVATSSKAGLALVAGGLVVKALYDRGKAREIERKRAEGEQP